MVVNVVKLDVVVVVLFLVFFLTRLNSTTP